MVMRQNDKEFCLTLFLAKGARNLAIRLQITLLSFHIKNMTIKLLLVDDQDTSRQGLAKVLSTKKDLEVVGQASYSRDAVSLMAALHPDVILMEMWTPLCDGVIATCEISQQYPWVKIVVLTNFDDEEYIWPSLQAGAIGYLLKSTPIDQLVQAIRSAYRGYAQLGPTIAPKVFGQIRTSSLKTTPSSDNSNNFSEALSTRELEVLKLMAVGKNNQEIAGLLHVTKGTVRNHISNILGRLGVRDRIHAILWANQHLAATSEDVNSARFQQKTFEDNYQKRAIP
jgi:DNA-binding NarL/FixJ family response regulator